MPLDVFECQVILNEAAHAASATTEKGTRTTVDGPRTTHNVIVNWVYPLPVIAGQAADLERNVIANGEQL